METGKNCRTMKSRDTSGRKENGENRWVPETAAFPVQLRTKAPQSLTSPGVIFEDVKVLTKRLKKLDSNKFTAYRRPVMCGEKNKKNQQQSQQRIRFVICTYCVLVCLSKVYVNRY